jgi:cytidylate kinase
MIIAIDGPAGAGKSTVSRALATRLGLEHLDTGAMYRAVTFGVLERGVDPSAMVEVADAAESIEIVIAGERVTVDGVDATTQIRGRDVTTAVSAVAANPMVRELLVGRQRSWVAERGGGVVEGRDITTVVLPDADLKLFVTASPRVRAQRRVAETGGDVEQIEASIVERDRRDATREASPMTIAGDAVVVDTSELGIDEVVDRVLDMIGKPSL